MTPSVTQVIRIYQKSLDRLAVHFVVHCMDDSEYIQIVRVLISAALGILVEDGETDGTIGPVESLLREHARDFYVAHCAKSHSESLNVADYKEECAELFDYIFEHGRYPDD